MRNLLTSSLTLGDSSVVASQLLRNDIILLLQTPPLGTLQNLQKLVFHLFTSMPARPIKTSGILHRDANGWSVALDGSFPTFEENAPVDIVLWDTREGTEKGEVERISEIQQIEPEIIALALSAEGALNK